LKALVEFVWMFIAEKYGFRNKWSLKKANHQQKHVEIELQIDW